jgi:bacterioferritin-associated ferredoxin
MIVCQCGAVSHQSVLTAVAVGAHSLGQVCRATNAGQDCGSCVSAVKQVLAGALEDCALMNVDVSPSSVGALLGAGGDRRAA